MQNDVPLNSLHPGFEAGPDREVTDTDQLGPLPGVPVKSIDWLLVFSVLFITGFTFYAILRTDSIRWLIPGQEHEHQDWLNDKLDVVKVSKEKIIMILSYFTVKGWVLRGDDSDTKLQIVWRDEVPSMEFYKTVLLWM